MPANPTCDAKGEDKELSISPKQLVAWLQYAGVLSLIAVLYGNVLIDLFVRCWRDEQLSQGLLMPVLAGYVVWIRRKALFACDVNPETKGLALTALACLMFAVGKLSAEKSLPRISFIVLIAGLIWTLWGRGRLRVLTLPLLLLATMVPIPTLIYNSISIPLRLISSSAAARIAQAAGIVLYQDGNVLQLPGLSLGVEDACNGIAALSSLFVSALLLGVLVEYRQRWFRILLVLLAIPIAIAVNIARIAGTAIVADSHPDFAAGFYHAFSGWVLYLLGFLTLYAVSTVTSAIVRRFSLQQAKCQHSFEIQPPSLR